jgi:hypothetical protein
VVIFVGPDRYEFVPAVLGRCTGHVYAGRLRPDAADVASRLARHALPHRAARTLAVVSAFEGGFDSIQTYDRGKFSWGFIQFTATGGLPRLLFEIKTLAPDLFRDYFDSAGVGIEGGSLTLRVDGRTLRGRRAHDRLHDDPSLWTPFLRASRDTLVQDIQVRTAYHAYYAQPLGITVGLPSGDITLGELFADDEYARAVVCDRAVNRGVGHTTLLFRQAARHVRARSQADAPPILARVRAMEAADAARLAGLEQKLRDLSL